MKIQVTFGLSPGSPAIVIFLLADMNHVAL